MSSQQCVDFVRERLQQNTPLPLITAQIFDHCLADDIRATQGLGGDNMTCIIVRFKKAI